MSICNTAQIWRGVFVHIHNTPDNLQRVIIRYFINIPSRFSAPLFFSKCLLFNLLTENRLKKLYVCPRNTFQGKLYPKKKPRLNRPYAPDRRIRKSPRFEGFSVYIFNCLAVFDRPAPVCDVIRVADMKNRIPRIIVLSGRDIERIRSI